MEEKPNERKPQKRRRRRQGCFGKRKRPAAQRSSAPEPTIPREPADDGTSCVIIVDPDGESFHLTAGSADLRSTYSYFEGERHMKIAQGHSPPPSSSSDVCVAEVSTIAVASSVRMSTGAVSWLRLAAAMHSSDGPVQSHPAGCGCIVFLAVGAEPGSRVEMLRVSRCALNEPDSVLGSRWVTDVLAALVVALQLGASGDVLDMLAASFAWHFSRMNRAECADAVDAYAAANPATVDSIATLVAHGDRRLLSSEVHEDCLSCAVTKDVRAAARLAKARVAFDRHVRVWPNCEAVDLPAEVVKRFDTTAVLIRDKTFRAFKSVCPELDRMRTTGDEPVESWGSHWKGSAVTGNAVLSEIEGAVWCAGTFYVRCADDDAAGRIAELAGGTKDRMLSTGMRAIGLVPGSSEFKSNFVDYAAFGNHRKITCNLSQSLSAILVVPIHPCREAFVAVGDAPIFPAINATLQSAAVQSELDCLYEFRMSHKRFAYSPSTETIHASLLALAHESYANEFSLCVGDSKRCSNHHERLVADALTASERLPAGAPVPDFEYRSGDCLAAAVSLAAIRAIDESGIVGNRYSMVGGTKRSVDGGGVLHGGDSGI